MSRRGPAKPGDTTAGKSSYEIGYGKPPAGRKFTSGTSGNPAGRPRKVPAEPQSSGTVSVTQRLWLEEASAPVKVRQDGRIRTLSAQEAVMLSIRNKALAGGPMAQRTYMASVQEAQRAEADAKFQKFAGLVEIEAEQRHELNRRILAGIAIDDLLPHPDDILIDPRCGWACLVGPLTPDERRGHQELADRCDAAQEVVTYAALAYEGATKRGRAKWLAMWLNGQRSYDMFNDLLPPSMKRPLTNRSSAVGATREGQFFSYSPETLQEEERKARQPKRRRGRDA